MKKTKLERFTLIGVCLILLIIIIKVKADPLNVEVIDEQKDFISVEDLTFYDNTREISVEVHEYQPGKRLSDFKYCLIENDCNDESNWLSVSTYDASNFVSEFQMSVGNSGMMFEFKVPQGKLKIKAIYADYEPMDITYSRYTKTTDNESELNNIYNDEVKNLSNYESTYNNLITGYRGGDIILPSDCTSNGCVLKITFDENDYNSILSRLNYFNENFNQDMDDYEFLDLASMNNHLETVNTDSIEPIKENDSLYIETEGTNKSIYLVVNKFFSEKNRVNFIIGDNKNRILSEDYIGVDCLLDKKYFNDVDGFLSFNEFNNYTQNPEIFYGAPVVKLKVDKVRNLALTNEGNASGVGTLNKPYTKIVSLNQDKYPINENFELTINSYYEQDYSVPIALKNDSNQTVQEITLNFSRFAFGGNAGSLLLVDDNAINCKDSSRNPDCREGHIHVSTFYRGLLDTFYTNGQTRVISSFMISNQRNGLTGEYIDNLRVYERDESFDPWATAIFYHDDEVVMTKSFNVGDIVKMEGFTETVIENDTVNNHAIEPGGGLITDYNSANYNIFGYGLGFEQKMNSIKYFDERSVENLSIEYPIILASKEEILDNSINRIALFLTNGELKSDEENFPELTYGVGEGKIFDIDGRVFEELGGGN